MRQRLVGPPPCMSTCSDPKPLLNTAALRERERDICSLLSCHFSMIDHDLGLEWFMSMANRHEAEAYACVLSFECARVQTSPETERRTVRRQGRERVEKVGERHPSETSVALMCCLCLCCTLCLWPLQ